MIFYECRERLSWAVKCRGIPQNATTPHMTLVQASAIVLATFRFSRAMRDRLRLHLNGVLHQPACKSD
jgi:hypothetical protein